MLTFDDTTFGAQECELNLTELYPDPSERSDFHKRLEAFVESDAFTKELFDLSGERLRYRSEVFASNRIDERPALLLLLGNPASHSVASGFAFAFEKSDQEHRFWKALRKVGILNFPEQASIEARRDALLDLEYDSPFRISIAVYYSMPSPASAKGWAGVSGLRKLLRARAFRKISHYETMRIRELVSRFISPGGGILAFQKDAYEGVRSQESPAYSLKKANAGCLKGKYAFDETVRLAGSPPTRIMQGKNAKRALEKHKNWLIGN